MYLPRWHKRKQFNCLAVSEKKFTFAPQTYLDHQTESNMKITSNESFLPDAPRRRRFNRWMATAILCAISVCAMAKSYPLYICGMQVNDTNRQQLTTLLTDLGILKSGNISFDGNKTLLLDNAVVDYSEKGIARFLSNGKTRDFEGIPTEEGIEDLVIKVIGTNTVTVTAQTDLFSDDDESMSYAMSMAMTMVAENYSFEGTGSLTVNALVEDNSLEYAAGYALWTFGNCNFMGGTYSFNGKTTGMMADGKVIFTGGNFTFTSEDYAALVVSDEKNIVMSSFLKWITPANPTFYDGCICTESGIPAKTVEIGPEEIELYVAGQIVTSDNCEDVLNDGHVSYDYVNNILILDNANIVSYGYTAAIDASELNGLNIELIGNNVIGGYGSDKCPYIALGKNATIMGDDNATLTVRVRDGIFFIDKLTLNKVNMDVHSRDHAFSGSTTESYQTAELYTQNYTMVDAYNEEEGQAVMNRVQVMGDEVTSVLLPANASSLPELLQYYDGRHVIIGNPGTYYRIDVCGWPLCENNKDYLCEGLTTQGLLSGGSISYDETNGTLLLNNMTLNSVMDGPAIKAVCRNLNNRYQKLNVEFRGNNVINSGHNVAIYIVSELDYLLQDLLSTTFKGNNGSLTINAGNEVWSGNIAAIASEGGGTVSFTGGTYNLTGKTYGVKTGGPLFIDGSNMTVEGDDCAIMFGDMLTVENANIVTPENFSVREYVNFYCIADEYGNKAKRVVVASEIPTEMEPIDNEQLKNAESWYTLDGRRLEAKPIQKGVYMRNGKKIVVK